MDEREKFENDLKLFELEQKIRHRQNPTLSKKPVDLFLLFNVVKDMGGYAFVSDKILWGKIVKQACGIFDDDNAASRCKLLYKNRLEKFETDFVPHINDSNSINQSHESLDHEYIQIDDDDPPSHSDMLEAVQVDLANAITEEALATLNPGQWLRDDVINHYMELIMNHCNSDESLPNIYIFVTHFFLRLTAPAAEQFADISRWTAHVNLFSLNFRSTPRQPESLGLKLHQLR